MDWNAVLTFNYQGQRHTGACSGPGSAALWPGRGVALRAGKRQ